MSKICLFNHERPIFDILTDKEVLMPVAFVTGLSALSCALVAKLFKSHVTTNALIALSIFPSHSLMHTIDHRITKNARDNKTRLRGIIALTILPQLALIKIASLRGHHISYLWAPTNTLTSLLSIAAPNYLLKKFGE